MRVSIFGLGYVGCVTSACLAKEGHEVVGVDVNKSKVDLINSGKSPIVEKGLDTLISDLVRRSGSGSLRASTDGVRAVQQSNMTLVCVGTPSKPNGSLDLSHVVSCARDLAKALQSKNGFHTIAVRSTMLPGSIRGVVLPTLEASGKKVGRDFGLVMNPEFLRESTSLDDFYSPAVTIIGEYDKRSGDHYAGLFEFLSAPLYRTSLETAEMVKYANNAFHALKIAFANEIGTLCKQLSIDGHTVMNIVCEDRKLNISPAYLKPGFAFGGSCLPKDLRAINYKAKEVDTELPVLQSMLHSNALHVQRGIEAVLGTGKRRVGILGLSFKAGTDDLRESPIVMLTEALIGKGLDIRVFDRDVLLARLTGSNKEYIENQIPHIASLMVETAEEAVQHGEVLVIANNSEAYGPALADRPAGTRVVDLVRPANLPELDASEYTGICW